MSLRNYFVIYFVLEYACCDACDVCIFLLYKFLIFPFKKFSECPSINKDFSKVGSTTQALVLPRDPGDKNPPWILVFYLLYIYACFGGVITNIYLKL